MVDSRLGTNVPKEISRILEVSKLPEILSVEVSQNASSIWDFSTSLVGVSPYTISQNYEYRIDEWLNDSLDRTFLLLSSILDVLYIHLERIPSEISLDNFCSRYFLYALVDKLEEKYKFHCAYLCCTLSPPSDLPPDNSYPDEIPGVILGGWVRRFFESSKVTLALKRKVAFSLQNAKRGAAPISLKKQLRAILDHQKNMTGGGYQPSNYKDRVIGRVGTKLDKLTQIYYPYEISDRIKEWRMPSFSSCSMESAKNFGSMGYFSDMYYNPEILGYDGFLDGAKKEIPLYSVGFDISDLTETLLMKVQEEHTLTTCQYHKILEPFKVRSITAADPEIYHLGRMIQPVLHGCIRSENGPFRFIGKRHNVEDINKVYAGSILVSPSYFEKFGEYNWKEGRHHPMFTFFVAGDYKNATDNMHPRLPRCFIRALKAHTDISERWITVLERTLGSHTIKYDWPLDSNELFGMYAAEYSQFKDEVHQSHGQLMGSPTSFPVLCLVNAAMFWASVERYECREVSWGYIVDHYRPLFNGDDISFLSNENHYKIWAEYCDACGLSLSPGKNYKSPDFVNINSTNYTANLEVIKNDTKGLEEWDEVFIVNDLEEMFIVNSGLLKGQAKVMEDTRKFESKSESLMPVCDQLMECLSVAKDEERVRTIEVFKDYMMPRLQNSYRPWSLPRHLGGLGLPFGSVTKTQFNLALKLVEEYKDLSDLKNHVNMTIEQGQEMLKDLLRSFDVEVAHGKIVDNTTEDTVEYYELPDCSHLFLNKKAVKKHYICHDLNGERLVDHPEYKYVKALRKISLKHELKEIDPGVLEQLQNTKLISGGLLYPLWRGVTARQ